MSNKRSRAAFESHADGPPAHAPYVLYGTPLPPYDPESRDDGSYVPIWKQEVTDEHGRKRLHGAFTGGWSAGYFNTVGSKEGWTPSTFVSSRSNRAKDAKKDGGGQQVEDFMDEEDLAERAESQKLETQGTFAGLGSAGDGGASRGGGMFADLFRATGETMGMKLLQRMGWKQGQGIGPKVRRRIEGDTKGKMHLFAPEDSKVINFSGKTDRKGLGFAGEEKLGSDRNPPDADSEEDDRDATILRNSRSQILTKPKKLKRSGIGIGVLNETGSDGEDEYSMGPSISYNRIIGGDRKKKKAGLVASNASPTVQKPIAASKKLAQRTSTLSGFRKCHDGRLPIDGFVLSLAPLSISQENQYPPPTPPEGWRPSKLAAAQQNGANGKAYESTADAAKASTLDAKSRAALLGEQQLPGKSVFDFMSPAARERLAGASGKSNLPPALGEGAPAGFVTAETEKRKTLWDLIPPLDTAVAAAALHRGRTGWMPYSEDEAKRDRYRYFLELRAGLQSNLPDRPKAFSIDEWAKEMREFAQAAAVFKPVSGLMASRFTSSSSTPRLASDAPDSATPESAREEDPAEKAAKMGMFGHLTRSRQTFFPTRLLCKRFNVRAPANVAGDASGTAADREVDESRRLDIVSQASLDRMMQEASTTARAGSGFVSGGVEDGDAQQGIARRKDWAVVDSERNESLEGARPGEEVFQAVFGDESEQ